MSKPITIKINFRGGIISPGDLYNILVALGKYGIHGVRFGLRQQLLILADGENFVDLGRELDTLRIQFETSNDHLPNIVSSYPAEEVFINHTWLSEGVYKDVLDSFDYPPLLKINISDNNQSFTPLLTGNINWVASPVSIHYWHLFIRFPRTNIVYEWKEIINTNDIGRMSKKLEQAILQNKSLFYDQPVIDGEKLYDMVRTEVSFNTRPSPGKLKLPDFNLPYYEGLNRYNNNKYWLGIYRRDEEFSIDFLKELCRLCLDTKLGQVCSTPWKSIIIKGIEEEHRKRWNDLLAKYQVNVRHAANELNFQVEDNCEEGLMLKNYLVRFLTKDDVRTFGLCMGVKTRNKSEVYSSILVRKRPLLRIGGRGFFHLYDVLIAKDFNPNERTGIAFSRYNLKVWLPEQIRRALILFYSHRVKSIAPMVTAAGKEHRERNQNPEFVYQCSHCKTIYEESVGDPQSGIPAGTIFEHLEQDFCCPTCESEKDAFIKVEKQTLGLHTV